MKKLIVILLFMSSLLCSGQYGFNAPHISFYWGYTYRSDNKLYNSFDISKEHYRSGCTFAYYKGYGMRLDVFNNDNFSFSVRYFRAFERRPGPFLTPYLGISPVGYKMENSYGLSIKPEIGARLNTNCLTRRQVVSLSLNLTYGYDIPMINSKDFLPGRHDLSLRVGISINTWDLRYYINKRRTERKEAQEKKLE